jgi:hypothetical protein
MTFRLSDFTKREFYSIKEWNFDDLGTFSKLAIVAGRVGNVC